MSSSNISIVLRLFFILERLGAHYVVENGEDRLRIIPKKGVGDTDDAFAFACRDSDRRRDEHQKRDETELHDLMGSGS